jgi:hypothetical protein
MAEVLLVGRWYSERLLDCSDCELSIPFGTSGHQRSDEEVLAETLRFWLELSLETVVISAMTGEMKPHIRAKRLTGRVV